MPHKKEENWQIKNADVFWGEVAPCQHLLQLYENENVFLSTLEGFVKNGFDSGESVIVLATRAHLQTLQIRLQFQGYKLSSLKAKDLFIPLEANEALAKFMVNDWPEEALFIPFVSSVISRASAGGRKVRAFGEMVALLWENGLSGATVHLEQLWERYLHKEPLNLFCAYPKSGFTRDAHLSLQDICACHSMLIAGDSKPTTEIFYHNSPTYSPQT